MRVLPVIRHAEIGKEGIGIRHAPALAGQQDSPAARKVLPHPRGKVAVKAHRVGEHNQLVSGKITVAVDDIVQVLALQQDAVGTDVGADMPVLLGVGGEKRYIRDRARTEAPRLAPLDLGIRRADQPIGGGVKHSQRMQLIPD